MLLYLERSALGYRTYQERFRRRTIASLTYFQVSLPSLDARAYAKGDNALAQALASAMRLPDPEDARQGIHRTAIAAILDALGRAEMDDDAAAALWTLMTRTYLPDGTSGRGSPWAWDSALASFRQNNLVAGAEGRR